MKIAMIGQKRIPSREGGVEIVVEELATRMVKLGHEVTCYNRGGKHVLDKNKKIEKIKEYKGIKLKKCFTIDKNGLAAMTSSFFGTLKILFSNADIVHYHAEGPCAMIPFIKFFSRKKIIATIHGLDWETPKWGNFAKKYIKFGEKMAVKYADEIIVLNTRLQKYFFNNYKRKTLLIPNGVNEPKVLKISKISKLFNLTKNNYILYLGRVVPDKGIEYLIDAFVKLDTNKKLVIAGGDDQPLYYNELKKRTHSNKNIIFTGFVEGEILEELYSNCYLFCLPSNHEGMPLCLLEAMSYGNCCLTSNIKECIEIIENKGITFKKADTNDLKNKLNELLNNPEKVNKFKEISKDYILNKYNWDKVTETTLKLYNEVTSK